MDHQGIEHSPVKGILCDSCPLAPAIVPTLKPKLEVPELRIRNAPLGSFC